MTPAEQEAYDAMTKDRDEWKARAERSAAELIRTMIEPKDVVLTAFYDDESGETDYQHKFPFGLLVITVGKDGELRSLDLTAHDKVRRLEPWPRAFVRRG